MKVLLSSMGFVTLDYSIRTRSNRFGEDFPNDNFFYRIHESLNIFTDQNFVYLILIYFLKVMNTNVKKSFSETFQNDFLFVFEKRDG